MSGFHTCKLLNLSILTTQTTKCFSESLSVFGRHNVIQNGIDGRRDVITDARDVHQVLINRSENVGLFEINVTKTLCVKWGPTQKKCDDNRG